jgi:hypothetical protein
MIVLVLAMAASTAQPTLASAWTVDLSAEPGKPYTKSMVLNLSADGSVTGTFYDSQIEQGRWKTDRGRTCASFRTTDGVGPYHTSVCLRAGAAEGQTWAEHRKFLFNWTAAKAR